MLWQLFKFLKTISVESFLKIKKNIKVQNFENLIFSQIQFKFKKLGFS